MFLGDGTEATSRPDMNDSFLEVGEETAADLQHTQARTGGPPRRRATRVRRWGAESGPWPTNPTNGRRKKLASPASPGHPIHEAASFFP
jgi:hypothetical protein